jgi:hypothetical protein
MRACGSRQTHQLARDVMGVGERTRAIWQPDAGLVLDPVVSVVQLERIDRHSTASLAGRAPC